MDTDDDPNNDVDKLENLVKPEIYVKKVISAFAFLFSSIFGGIILMQNLRDINKKKEANLVLLVSILITVSPMEAAIAYSLQSLIFLKHEEMQTI